MKRWNIALRVGVFLICLCLMIGGLTAVLKDKRVTFPYDPTRKVEGFYAEEKNSLDFIFIGSSQLFTSVTPAVLWSEFGITSYDFAANEQTFELSYTYIQEALKYQRPKAVILEISYCLEPNYAREGVKRINLDPLRWGLPKLQAILETVGPGERFSYLFELSKYHDTWADLDQTSMEYLLSDKHNPYKGYTPSDESEPDGVPLKEEIAAISERKPLPEIPMEYLQKMIDYTKEQGVDLLLLKTPNGNAENQPYYNTVEDLAAEQNIPFLNLNSEMGGEKHNNVCYADDITVRIGEWLTGLYEVEDKRGQEAYAQWDEDAQYYYHRAHAERFQEKETFPEYLAHAAEGGYAVFLAVDGSGTESLTPECQELLRSLGLNAGVSDGDSYIAAFDSENIYVEECSREGRSYKNKLFGHVITLVSQGEEAGNCSEIGFDGVAYTKIGRGLHAVIYDPLLDEIVSYRTFWQ
ncbi:MAG: hypothetical protein ACI4DV_05805 [Lachnospiraceae bacterium]